MYYIYKLRKAEAMPMAEVLALPTWEKAIIEQDWLEDMPSTDRFNLYWGIYDSPNGRNGFTSQSFVPFDIDHVEPKDRDQVLHHALAVLGLEHDQVLSLWSGHGLQFFVRVAPFVDPKFFAEGKPAYHSLCKQIDSRLLHYGLTGKCDPVVFCKSRLMRVPNTINRKDGMPDTHAVLINETSEQVENPLHKVMANMDSEDPDYRKEFPKTDPNKVLSSAGCSFLEEAKSNPNLSEPHWWTMIDIIMQLYRKTPEVGEQVCIDYSKGHPGFNEEKVRLKARQTLENSPGAPSCRRIELSNPGCRACPHWQTKVKSPVQIVGEDVIQTEETQYWDVDKKGNPTQPNYEDLIKMMRRDYHFVNLYHLGKDGTAGKPLTYICRNTDHNDRPTSYHWVQLSGEQVKRIAQVSLGNHPKTREAHRKEFLHRVQTEPSHRFDHFFDPSHTKGLIAFRNGVLNVVTSKFEPSQPTNRFRDIIDYDYDANAQCPKFEQFMQEVTVQDLTLQATLMQFVGAGLAGYATKIQKAAMLMGEGGNGKSVFIETMRSTLGEDNCSAVSLGALRNPTYAAGLIGKRFNFAEESDIKSLIGTDQFKNAVNGGLIDIHIMHTAKTMTRVDCMFLVAANQMPMTDEKNEALWRRILFIPFDAKFNEANRDIFLVDKLKKERAGVMNWILRELEVLRQNEFVLPESPRSKLNQEDAKTESSTVRFWIKEFCSFYPSLRRPNGGVGIDQHTYNEDVFGGTKELYANYQEDFPHSRMSFQRFSRQLRQELEELVGKVDWRTRNQKLPKRPRGIFGLEYGKQSNFTYDDKHELIVTGTTVIQLTNEELKNVKTITTAVKNYAPSMGSSGGSDQKGEG